MRSKLILGYALTVGLCLAGMANAQPPLRATDQPPTPPTPFPSPVYRTSSVARFLALQDQQVDALNQMTAGLIDRYRPQYDSIAGLSSDQHTLARKEIDRKYVKDWIDGARVIMDDFQYNRFLHYLEERGVTMKLNTIPEPPKAPMKALAPNDLREPPKIVPESSNYRPSYVPPER
jgi:hypothetical protein